MAKKKKDIIEEEAFTITPTPELSQEEFIKSLPHIELPNLPTVKDLVKKYADKGFDDNRIAARLMISLEEVKKHK